MEILGVTVINQEEAEKLKTSLSKKPVVAKVVLITPGRGSTLFTNVKKPVGPMTAISELSLAESWNSPEDAFWDTVDLTLVKK